MKNLQYLKLFEAFESKTLTKVFNYVNKSQRGQFKSILEEFCNKIKFPMSKLSDDLFQYLPYNKALSLAANMEDEPCEAGSPTIPGEKCSGPTGDELQGTILRIWGKGRRKVKCDVCNGTGIKPKNSFPIKWVKFWFDKDGKYVNATATDGKIRPQSGFGSAKEEEEVKPDPYTWNAPLEIRRISLGSSADVKEYLKQAHFALILDYVKMKEMMRGGKVTDTDVTKAEREESKKGALALELPNDIKAANFDRYIKQISKNIKITDDISSLRRIFQRVLGFGYAGHYILQGLNFSAMEVIFDNIVNFMTSNDSDKQRYVDRASREIKDRMEANIEYNNNMKKNLDYLVTGSPDEDHTNIVEMLIEVNKAIVKKIQDAPLETIEDALILYNKIRNMRDSYRNSSLFKKCQKASNVNYYLEAGDLDQPLRYLKAIDNSEIPDMLSNFDQYINYINKL
jgi:hypothetical protein